MTSGNVASVAHARRPGVEAYLFDVSEAELAKAGPGYETLCLDIAAAKPVIKLAVIRIHVPIAFIAPLNYDVVRGNTVSP